MCEDDSDVIAQEREAVRAEVYSLLAGLLSAAPTQDQLAALRGKDLLCSLRRRLQECGLQDLPELGELAAAIGTTADEWGAVRREFNRLFLGPGKLPAPPWESVYLSPDRLVMQEPAREVLREYVDAGVGYDGMMGCPPDHVAKELGFMATLIQLAVDRPGDEAMLRERQQRFVQDHLLRWVPRFCADLEGAPSARFYRIVARMLRRFLDSEARGGGRTSEYSELSGGAEQGLKSR